MGFKKLPDLTTSGQKFIAAMGVLAVGVGLYYVLPPMVVLLKNLWLAAALGVPFLALVFNYELVWDMFKQLSWRATKKYVSANPIWHMYRYHDYMLQKIQGLYDAIVEVKTIRVKSARRVEELTQEMNGFVAQKEALAVQDSPVGRVLASKIATNKRNIDNITPRITFIDNQLNQLMEVHTIWSADAETLKHELDSKSQEYETLKELSGASDKASYFLGDNSSEMKMFKESLSQIENSVSQYTANIAAFETKLMPQLLQSGSKLDYNVAEGEKIFEQLKQERLKIN